MSNAKTARFGPAVKWEGYIKEAMKKHMDCSPVSGHYTDAKYWSCHQNYDLGAGDRPKPLAIRALGSFVGVGAVAACKVAVDDAVDCLGKGDVSRHKLEHSLKKIGKESAYWGAAAGAFESFEFGAEVMRGRSDWKNALIGGALAGATVSAAASYGSQGGNVLAGAIAGGAIGTAFEFISNRRHVDRLDQPHQLRTDDATDQTLELTARSHVVIEDEM